MTTPEVAAVPDRKPDDREIDVWGLTNVGKVRKENQDNFLIASLHKRLEVHGTSLAGYQSAETGDDRLAFIAVVADGVGGGEQGEAASRVTVETVMDYIAHSMRAYYGTDAREETFMQALQDAAMQCHAKVMERAEAEGARSMATTLTLYLGVWPWTYLLQVGDSRYYVFREGELTQVTRDQTMAQDLVEQGVFTRADAEKSRSAPRPWRPTTRCAPRQPHRAPSRGQAAAAGWRPPSPSRSRCGRGSMSRRWETAVPTSTPEDAWSRSRATRRWRRHCSISAHSRLRTQAGHP